MEDRALWTVVGRETLPAAGSLPETWGSSGIAAIHKCGPNLPRSLYFPGKSGNMNFCVKFLDFSMSETNSIKAKTLQGPVTHTCRPD